LLMSQLDGFPDFVEKIKSLDVSVDA